MRDVTREELDTGRAKKRNLKHPLENIKESRVVP